MTRDRCLLPHFIVFAISLFQKPSDFILNAVPLWNATPFLAAMTVRYATLTHSIIANCELRIANCSNDGALRYANTPYMIGNFRVGSE